jgi:vacuolar-type H+-ATPase subunit H
MARAMDRARNNEYERFVREYDEQYDYSCRIIEAERCEAELIISEAREAAESIIEKAEGGDSQNPAEITRH